MNEIKNSDQISSAGAMSEEKKGRSFLQRIGEAYRNGIDPATVAPPIREHVPIARMKQYLDWKCRHSS